MRKHCIRSLWLLVLALPAIALAQGERWGASLTPSLFPMENFALQPGVQYTFNERWSILGEVAVPTSHSKDPRFEQIHLIRYGAELRYFAPAFIHHSYYAVQLTYFQRRFIDRDSGSYRDHYYDETSHWYRSTSVHSPVLAFSVQTGREILLGAHIYLDLFVGLGVRGIFTKYKAEDVRNLQSVRPKDIVVFSPPPSWKYNSTMVRFHMPFGLRVIKKF